MAHQAGVAAARGRASPYHRSGLRAACCAAVASAYAPCGPAQSTSPHSDTASAQAWSGRASDRPCGQVARPAVLLTRVDPWPAVHFTRDDGCICWCTHRLEQPIVCVGQLGDPPLQQDVVAVNEDDQVVIA
eukprot:scaffold131879_cov60-Phaeocystis_antarctica.AAC.5